MFRRGGKNMQRTGAGWGDTHDGQVMVQRSERMWSTGEGIANQYSCLENPRNSIKRLNDMLLKQELPRPVGAKYATGD